MDKQPNYLINDSVVAGNTAIRKSNNGSRYDKPADPVKVLFKQKIPAEKSANFQSGHMFQIYVAL